MKKHIYLKKNVSEYLWIPRQNNGSFFVPNQSSSHCRIFSYFRIEAMLGQCVSHRCKQTVIRWRQVWWVSRMDKRFQIIRRKHTSRVGAMFDVMVHCHPGNCKNFCSDSSGIHLVPWLLRICSACKRIIYPNHTHSTRWKIEKHTSSPFCVLHIWMCVRFFSAHDCNAIWRDFAFIYTTAHM